MYRVVLECSDVPPLEGAEAATDIESEFREHRPHHQNVKCTFQSGRRVLGGENNLDAGGRALMDEFSDCISAYIATPFDGGLRLVSSKVI